MARKGRAPRWAQWLILWIVVSGLLSTGLMYLRARGVVGDGAFQALARPLCGKNARLETAYSSRETSVTFEGQYTPVAGRQQISTGLDSAVCVTAEGTRTDVAAGFTAAMIALGGLAGGVMVGSLAAFGRR